MRALLLGDVVGNPGRDILTKKLAALRAKRQVDFCIANVENASYRLTCCAEQSAIAAAVTLYGPEIRIRAIAIVNLNGAASMPCGACRQTLLEFSTQETAVFYPNADGETVSATLAALLPDAFRLATE